MKTYILQLGEYDDLVSVRDKMGWAKNGRIVIVWPEKASILSRRLDLLLIQRRSQKLGSQLAIVSRDPEVRYQALRLGIPVFRDLRKAQYPHWRVPFRFRRKSIMTPEEYRQVKEEIHKGKPLEKPNIQERPLKPAIRFIAFLAGILAFLSIAATLAPSARLTVTPKEMVQDVLIDFRTNSLIGEINLAGTVPSVIVTVQVEGRDSIPVSGKVSLPTNSARGEAEFKNLTDQVVDIPVGTVVRTADEPAIRFETLQTTQVPAGPEATILVAIECLSPGKTGNLPTGSLAAIEGDLGTELAVTNPQVITGGSDRVEPEATERDLDKLTGQLEKALEQTAVQEIQNQLVAGDIYIPSSLLLVRTVEEDSSPKVGEPADELTVNLRMEFQIRVIRNQTISRLVDTVFNSNLSQDYEAIPGSLQIEVVKTPEQTENGDYTGQLHATRRVIAKITDTQVINLALGASSAQAVSKLQAALPLEEPPMIQISPGWWPRLPILPFRINVQNESQAMPAKLETSGS